MENGKGKCHPLLLYKVHRKENHPNLTSMGREENRGGMGSLGG